MQPERASTWLHNKCPFALEQRSQSMSPLQANICKAIGKLHVLTCVYIKTQGTSPVVQH